MVTSEIPGILFALIRGVKTRKIKELEMTKELHLPLIRKEPAFEQPRLELPLPSSLTNVKQDERKKEDTTERGVWTIDI